MSTAKKRIYLNLAENERNGSFKEAAKLYSGVCICIWVVGRAI